MKTLIATRSCTCTRFDLMLHDDVVFAIITSTTYCISTLINLLELKTIIAFWNKCSDASLTIWSLWSNVWRLYFLSSMRIISKSLSKFKRNQQSRSLIDSSIAICLFELHLTLCTKSKSNTDDSSKSKRNRIHILLSRVLTLTVSQQILRVLTIYETSWSNSRSIDLKMHRCFRFNCFILIWDC